MSYATATSAPAVNKVLTNTYLLLSMTLVWSAICTYLTLEVEMTLAFALGGFIGSLALLFAFMAEVEGTDTTASSGDKLASLKGF